MSEPRMGTPPGSGINLDKPDKKSPIWKDFYKYLVDNWWQGRQAQGVGQQAANPAAQPGDLGYVGVQDSGMAMATANLIQKRKQQQDEILRQLDAGNTGILQSPTVR
jgi:hypothetical protein